MRYYYQFEKIIKLFIIFCMISVILSLTSVVINVSRPKADYNPNENIFRKYKIHVEEER